MRALLLGLAMSLFPGTDIPVQKDLTPQQIFTGLADSTLSLKVEYKKDGTGLLATARGSSVIVDLSYLNLEGTFILTAYHVVEPYMTIPGKITTSYQNKDLPLEIVAMNASYDLALLHTKEKLPYRAISVADFDPDLFSSLYIMGYPASQIYSPSAFIGTLSSKHRPFDARFLWQINGWMYSGMSGGPVVNGEGKLVCLTEAFATANFSPTEDKEILLPLPNVGLCTPRMYISILLNNYAIKMTPASY